MSLCLFKSVFVFTANGKQDKSKSSEEKSSKHEKPDKKHEKLDRKVEKSDKKAEKPAEKPMKSKSTSRPLPTDFKVGFTFLKKSSLISYLSIK